ncbi:MAG: hypothetical protein WCO98_16590 [bacterium]
MFFILTVAALLAIARPIEFNDNLTAVEKRKLVLDHELLTKQTVVALDFTADQRAAIIPILEATVADLDKIRDEKEKSIPLFNTAIIKLREDMYVNNGITDVLKLRVKSSYNNFTLLEYAYSTKSQAWIDEIWSLLTPAQKVYFRKGDTPSETRDKRRLNAALLNGYALYLLKPEAGIPDNDDVVPASVKNNIIDTRLLNLFNVLFITPDQSSQLMTILKSAKKDYDMLQQRNIVLAKIAVPVLEKMLKDTKDAMIATQYADIKADEKKIDADYAATDMKYLKQLKEMLTENQIRTIGNFTPVIDLPAMGQVMWKAVGSEDTDQRIASFLISSNLIPLLQARIDGDIFPPMAKK